MMWEGHLNRGEKNPGIMVLGVCSVNVTECIRRIIRTTGWDLGVENWVSSLEFREKTSIATCQNNPSGASGEKGLLNSTYFLLIGIFSFSRP